MEWLAEVYNHHQEWIKIAKVYGLAHNAEDAVQDMYIKLHKYASEEKVFTHGHLNKGYVFFTLKSIVLTYHKNKVEFLPLDTRLSDNTDLEEHVAWQQLCRAVEEEQKTWTWYDNLLFQEYKITDQSIRKLAAKYDISWVDVWKTLKKCKLKINENLKDEYEAYKKSEV